MRRFIKWAFGGFAYQKLSKLKQFIKNVLDLITNFLYDGLLFYRHSMVFKKNSFNKIEAQIILNYHSIEKGFLHDEFKYRFGETHIKELIQLLRNNSIIKHTNRTQIAAAFLALCTYYEKHQAGHVDISDFFPRKDYDMFKSRSTLNCNVFLENKYESFSRASTDNFFDFSHLRSSIRSFTGELIPFELITKAIDLAKTAPSVCNRQATKVYYLDNKIKIETILNIQNGLKGYFDGISQLLIVVTDRNYFYSIGERNQMFIDGGVFLMNLLYALNFYKIGACPAHWAFTKGYDKLIMEELNLKNSEKVLCLIAIGVPKGNYRTTLSLRRETSEILVVR